MKFDAINFNVASRSFGERFKNIKEFDGKHEVKDKIDSTEMFEKSFN